MFNHLSAHRTVSTGTFGTTATLAPPSGARPGNLLYATILAFNTPTASTGWTLDYAAGQNWVAHRTMDGTSADTLTLTFGAAAICFRAIYAIDTTPSQALYGGSTLGIVPTITFPDDPITGLAWASERGYIFTIVGRYTGITSLVHDSVTHLLGAFRSSPNMSFDLCDDGESGTRTFTDGLYDGVNHYLSGYAVVSFPRCRRTA